MDLHALGFDESYLAQVDGGALDAFVPARVMAVHKGMYLIEGEAGASRAELTGRFMYTAETSLDYPTVGDWVMVQLFDAGELAIIHRLLPRKTVLKRKSPGKLDVQLLGANIDMAFIVQSLDGNAGVNRLERYLVMVYDGGCDAVLLLSKTDLVSADAQEEIQESIHTAHPDLAIIAFSNILEDGLAPIRQILEPGKTYCVLGSSGVGKTSLINHLLGEAALSVGDVRAWDGKGRHTTTSRQLIPLDGGAILIDTPGLRELGNFDVEAGLTSTFEDIYALAASCRFNDCSHTHEDGCAVRAAVDDGLLEQSRYEHFLQLQRESNYYSMSALERRQRERLLGKTYKQMKRDFKKRKGQ